MCLIFVTLRGRLDDEAMNWTFREGMTLRDAPYGRFRKNQDMINHKYPDYSLRKIKLYKNKQSTVHDTDNNVTIEKTESGGAGAGDGVQNKSLAFPLKSNGPNSVYNSSTKTPPHPLSYPSGSNSRLGCEEIATLTLKRRVGRGTTKDVYSSDYGNTQVAVKMVSPKVPDIRACMRRKMFRSKEECYVYANYKILKEIALAQQLQHPNIAKVSLIHYLARLINFLLMYQVLV